jgi:hypothetical protein
MHYAHVKRKENHMNRYILEEFHSDPALRRRLFGEARHERTRAVRAGLAWLLRQAKARLRPLFHLRPSRWIERLG